MKTMMKTVMMLLMVCMTISVMAQQPRTGRPSPENRARIMAERMKQHLALTDQQVEQITQLNLVFFKTPMPQDSVARKKMWNDRMEQMKKILTPEQYQKWSEMQKSQMQGNRTPRQTPEEMVARRVALMKKELGLTDQQASQIEQMQLEALKNKNQKAADRKKQRIAEQEKMEKILTPEQYTKWIKLQKRMQRQAPRGGNHPGGPNRFGMTDRVE